MMTKETRAARADLRESVRDLLADHLTVMTGSHQEDRDDASMGFHFSLEDIRAALDTLEADVNAAF